MYEHILRFCLYSCSSYSQKDFSFWWNGHLLNVGQYYFPCLLLSIVARYRITFRIRGFLAINSNIVHSNGDLRGKSSIELRYSTRLEYAGKSIQLTDFWRMANFDDIYIAYFSGPFIWPLVFELLFQETFRVNNLVLYRFIFSRRHQQRMSQRKPLYQAERNPVRNSICLMSRRPISNKHLIYSTPNAPDILIVRNWKWPYEH